jgi:hypothetical protein
MKKIGRKGANDPYSGSGTGDVPFYGNTGETTDVALFFELYQRGHLSGIFPAGSPKAVPGVIESDSVP